MYSHEDILAKDKITVIEAAEYLDASPEVVRCGLIQHVLPIGAAILGPGGRWVYHISPGLLVAYKRGTLNITLAPDRDAI